jgi:hypothetical protein
MSLVDILQQRYVNKPTILKLTLLSICCVLITNYFMSSSMDVTARILMALPSSILCSVDFVLVLLFVMASVEKNMIQGQKDIV